MSSSLKVAACALAATALVGCGSSTSGNASSDGGALDAGVDSSWMGAPVGEGGTGDDEPPLDAAKPETDSGEYPLCDGGAIAADRFVTSVVTFTPGDCAGFGAAQMPVIIEGPPVGHGDSSGGLDVVSLGNGGTIVVGFGPNAIVDGPGADFIVFENVFFVAGNTLNPNAELGEVSVSDDGTTWTTFPCTATSYPYGACAGWHPVESSPTNCISPVDPATAGGDAFDLHDIDVTHAKFVRIVDKGSEPCSSDPSQKLTSNGFDLDAVSIVNAAQ